MKPKKKKLTKYEENLLMYPPTEKNELYPQYVAACEFVGITPGTCRWKYKTNTKIPIVFPRDGTKWITQEDFQTED